MNVNPRLWVPLLLLPVTVFFIYSFTKPDNPNTELVAASVDGIVPLDDSYAPGTKFDQYWYEGKAELNSYDLQQARYGEIHQGTAVLVFVAEDFSTKALTKSNGQNGPAVPVLKVNFDKKFNTGIYPYSMMLSTATPVDIGKYPHSLKVATSSQEWCGHTYTQLNLRGNKYEMTEHSYFPGEGDSEQTLAATFLEDEIWTRIRIAPEHLPTGEFDIIPGTFYNRLRHQPTRSVKAKASMTEAVGGEKAKVYTVEFPNRRLAITFSEDFPHQVLGWEESYTSGFGRGASTLTTRATLKKSMKLDYWNRNGNADAHYRQKLGLE